MINESSYFSKKFREELVKLSVNKDFNIAKNEWIHIRHYYNEDGSECICTHDINHEHTIKNILNGQITIIGSKCILHISKELYEIIMKQESIINRLMKSPESCLTLRRPDLEFLYEICKCIDIDQYKFYHYKETKDTRLSLYNDCDLYFCSIIIKIYDYFNTNLLLETYKTKLQNKLKRKEASIIILDVAFKDKEQAKKLGCIWKPDIKKWTCKESNLEALKYFICIGYLEEKTKEKGICLL